MGPGISARPTATGFVAVDLGYEADPIAFTPDVIASEKAALPGWRWRKEYERDFGAQAGMPVFEPEWLDAQRSQIRNPECRLAWGQETNTVSRHETGDILVWGDPDEPRPGQPAGFGPGPPRPCGIGIDVGEGVGQSDSTIQVFFADTIEQCAEFASNTIKPTDLGRVAVALAKHYNNALICCVRKMHGITVLRSILDDCGYQTVWRQKSTDRVTEINAASYGWPGGEASSPYLFGTWIDAIQHRRAMLHSQTTLDQHRQYIYDVTGRITHQARADLPAQVRERHGDLVIGCALAYRACLDQRGPAMMAGVGRSWPERGGWGGHV